MDEFSKEIQLDFLCDMSEPEVGTHELFALLGFVQASCDYSEFMFRCIYETLTERIEKLRKENEKLAEKYERTVDNLDAVLKGLEEEKADEKEKGRRERNANKSFMERQELAMKNIDCFVKEIDEKEKKGKTIPEMLKGIHEGLVNSFDTPLPRCYGKCIPCTEACVSCSYYGVCMIVSKREMENNSHE